MTSQIVCCKKKAWLTCMGGSSVRPVLASLRRAQPCSRTQHLSNQNCARTGSVQQRAAQADAHELVLPTAPFLSAGLCTVSFLISSQIRSRCLASKVRLQVISGKSGYHLLQCAQSNVQAVHLRKTLVFLVCALPDPTLRFPTPPMVHLATARRWR